MFDLDALEALESGLRQVRASDLTAKTTRTPPVADNMPPETAMVHANAAGCPHLSRLRAEGAA